MLKRVCGLLSCAFVLMTLAGCESESESSASVEGSGETDVSVDGGPKSAEDFLPVPENIPVMWQAQYEDALAKTDTPRGAVSLSNASLAIGNELLHARNKQGYRYLVQAGEMLRRAQELGVEVDAENLSSFLYSEARGLANTGQEEQAFSALKSAVENGLSDLRGMQLDPDLEPIRNMDGFEDLVAKVEKASTIAAKAKAKADLASAMIFSLDFALTDIDGNEQSLDKYKGKVLIVDLWGTWCPPCRAELPTFIEMQDTYGDQGFQMIGINYERVRDEEKKVQLVKKFVAENNINYPCIIGTDEIQNQVPEFNAFPTTLFIDRSGNVRLKAVGFKEHQYVKALVETLLAEPAPSE